MTDVMGERYVIGAGTLVTITVAKMSARGTHRLCREHWLLVDLCTPARRRG